MDYNNLDCVNPGEVGVTSSDEEEREEETQPRKERARCGVERYWDVNCHQHHNGADDVDNDDLT